jgi:hypothetical protein
VSTAVLSQPPKVYSSVVFPVNLWTTLKGCLQYVTVNFVLLRVARHRANKLEPILSVCCLSHMKLCNTERQKMLLV